MPSDFSFHLPLGRDYLVAAEIDEIVSKALGKLEKELRDMLTTGRFIMGDKLMVSYELSFFDFSKLPETSDVPVIMNKDAKLKETHYGDFFC